MCVPRAGGATVDCVSFPPIDQRQLDHVCPHKRSQAVSASPVSLQMDESCCLHAEKSGLDALDALYTSLRDVRGRNRFKSSHAS